MVYCVAAHGLEFCGPPRVDGLDAFWAHKQRACEAGASVWQHAYQPIEVPKNSPVRLVTASNEMNFSPKISGRRMAPWALVFAGVRRESLSPIALASRTQNSWAFADATQRTDVLFN